MRARRRGHLRLDLVNRQIGEANDLDRLTERLADGEEKAEGQLDEQRDVTILRSLPSVGRIVLATLLAEATDASAKARLSRPAMPIGRRAGHQAIGQEQNRFYETGRSRPPGQRRLPSPRHGATTPTHHPRTPRSPESQLPSLESDKLSPRD